MFYISYAYYAGLAGALLSIYFRRTVKFVVTNIFEKKKKSIVLKS